MTALNELRRHMGLDWKKMGREETRAHLRQSLARMFFASRNSPLLQSIFPGASGEI